MMYRPWLGPLLALVVLVVCCAASLEVNISVRQHLISCPHLWRACSYRGGGLQDEQIDELLSRPAYTDDMRHTIRQRIREGKMAPLPNSPYVPLVDVCSCAVLHLLPQRRAFPARLGCGGEHRGGRRGGGGRGGGDGSSRTGQARIGVEGVGKSGGGASQLRASALCAAGERYHPQLHHGGQPNGGAPRRHDQQGSRYCVAPPSPP